MILVDLSLELISVKRFLLQKFIDSLLLIQNENKIVVNVQSFIYNSQVLLNGLRNCRLCLVYNLIVSWNIPKMLLITALNCVLWSWQISTLVDNMINNNFQFVLYISQRYSKLDNVVLLVDVQFNSNKVILVWWVSIILSLNDLLRRRIGIIFKSLDEIHILIDRLLDQLTNLICHQSCSRFKESLSLIFVKIFKLFSQYIDCTLVPVSAQKSLNLLHLNFLMIHKLIKLLRLRSWFWKIDKEVSFIITPQFHELKSCLWADAEIFTHKHPSHHDVMFPFFVWLDTFIVVISPVNWLV